jgi:hypothetical protein
MIIVMYYTIIATAALAGQCCRAMQRQPKIYFEPSFLKDGGARVFFGNLIIVQQVREKRSEKPATSTYNSGARSPPPHSMGWVVQ